MAITQNTYTGDGSTVLFSFTFPYLETTDIKVTLDGSITTEYSLANATTLQFDAAPANGVAIRIYRETDDSALAATFYPGSAIRSQDLNENFTQNLYVTQESNNNAFTAIDTADSAVVTANAATATANTALSNSTTAVSTANAAASDAAAAVSTANTADTNASAAVATANSAATDAATAVSTANSAAADAATAISTANGAVTTADAAAVDAAAAVVTADSAAADAATAIATADSAASDAAAAVVTANTAASDASSAVTTSTSANAKADQAIAAVANALLFNIVLNVAAIPGSPADGDAVEVTDSTGIENFTPLANIPAGFVGDSGLGVRIIYDGTNTTWNWLQYFAQDPDNRYAGPNTPLGTAAAPSIAFGPGDTDTGIFSPGANEIAIATNGTAALTIDSSGAVNFTGIGEAEAFGVRQALALLDDSGVGVFLQAPTSIPAAITYTLPGLDGTSGQLLSTDGSGNLSWTSDVAVLVTDGGNFDNGSSTLTQTIQTLDGGEF